MPDDVALEVHASTLRIAFGRGERPYLFWLGSDPRRKVGYKVLSKRTASGGLEVRVVEEAGRARRVLVHRSLEPGLPAGWIEHWVTRLGAELGVSLRCYDLRHVQSPEEWSQVASTLGWSESGRP